MKTFTHDLESWWLLCAGKLLLSVAFLFCAEAIAPFSSYSLSSSQCYRENYRLAPCYIQLTNVAVVNRRVVFLLPPEAPALDASSPLLQLWPLQSLQGNLLEEQECLVEIEVQRGQLGQDLVCQVHEPSPALVFTVFNGPHFGHVLGNGVNDVFRTLLEANMTGGMCGCHKQHELQYQHQHHLHQHVGLQGEAGVIQLPHHDGDAGNVQQGEAGAAPLDGRGGSHAEQNCSQTQASTDVARHVACESVRQLGASHGSKHGGDAKASTVAVDNGAGMLAGEEQEEERIKAGRQRRLLPPQLFSSRCQTTLGAGHLANEDVNELQDPGPFDYVMRAITGGSATRSWRHLLRRSEDSVICFDHLTVGLSSDIDQYQLPMRRSEEGMRQFGRYVVALSADRLGQQLPQPPQLQQLQQPQQQQEQQQASWADASTAEPGGQAAQHAQQQLQQQQPPPPFQAVIISRNGNSRHIMNEAQLAEGLRQQLAALGVKGTVELLRFDDMDEAQQVMVASCTNLLVGMDGTGLLQSFFMPHPCGAVIKLNTYRMLELLAWKGTNFVTVGEACAGTVLQWNCTDPLAVHLPDEWNSGRLAAVRDVLLCRLGRDSNSSSSRSTTPSQPINADNAGSGGVDNGRVAGSGTQDSADTACFPAPAALVPTDREVTSFVKHQSIEVDVAEVIALVGQAIERMHARGCRFQPTAAATAAEGTVLVHDADG